VTAHGDGNTYRRSPLIRKFGWTALIGSAVYTGTEVASGVLHLSRADQLVLAVLTGGVTLLVQYLAEFEQRLFAFENHQRDSLNNLDATVQRGFAGVNEATELYEEIEKSALEHEALKQAIRRAGHFTDLTSPLVRRLANSEVERLTGTLQALVGNELFYDGEDREYLLALTRHARTSIMATSRANANGLEAGFLVDRLSLAIPGPAARRATPRS